jgi:hydrogenase nickel incorporation protein HypB
LPDDRERRQPRLPALFNLGERGKIVIISVTEGEDKPIEYPYLFRASDLLALNQIDLLDESARV